MKEGLSYDDVLLAPQYSDITSRSEIAIGNKLGDDWLDVPVIASPMDTVSGAAMAKAIHDCGAMAVLHRYNTPAEQANLLLRAKEDSPNLNVGVAVGVSEDYLMRVKLAKQLGANSICIDVAHGHHILMERALKTIRDEYGDELKIIAGNIATVEGFNALADWGADAIRVGIGGGSICSTRLQTGHGIPTLQSVLDCAQSDRNAQIIADGGIKNSGDIVKALAAGADFVMIGSMLAGTIEAPGSIIYGKDGNSYKTYRGMASQEAQIDWRGKTASVEGISTVVRTKGPLGDTMAKITLGIRSGFSYTGARTIEELHAKARFIRQTTAGRSESDTHILNRVNP